MIRRFLTHLSDTRRLRAFRSRVQLFSSESGSRIASQEDSATHFRSDASLTRLAEFCRADDSLRSPDIVKLLAESNRHARRLRISKSEDLDPLICSLDEKLKEIHCDTWKREHITELLRESILCKSFRKQVNVIGSRPKRSRVHKTRVVADVDEPGICDATAIPSGLDIYDLTDPRNRTPVLVELTGEFAPLRAPITQSQYVFAYNLPKTATDRLVREALCNVGTPSEVILLDTGAPKVLSPRMKEANEVALKNSPLNAIIRFEEGAAFERATRIESKLFGILCESENHDVDSARMMFLESAHVKRYLTFFGFSKKVRVSSIQDALIQRAREVGLGEIKFQRQAIEFVDLKHQLTVKFPSFEYAFAIFKELQTNPIPKTKVCFSMARSKWSDTLNEYVDASSAALSD